MTIRIQDNGSIVLIHDTRKLKAIHALLGGTVRTIRASHVEPVCASGQQKLPRWNVDLSPINGPSSLPNTFETREEALKAETLWIEQSILGPADANPIRLDISNESHPPNSQILTDKIPSTQG